MPAIDPELNRFIGIVLREKIRGHQVSTGQSYIKLSKKIGRDGNYLASYMVRDPAEWAIPKYPTMDLLLSEIGLKSGDLIQAASKRSRAAAGKRERRA